MSDHTIGDGPIDDRYMGQMKAMAEVLDEFLNPGLGNGDKRKVGFILMVFEFGQNPKGRCNYMSTADREDVKTLLREQLSYFEGMPSGEGKA